MDTLEVALRIQIYRKTNYKLHWHTQLSQSLVEGSEERVLMHELNDLIYLRNLQPWVDLHIVFSLDHSFERSFLLFFFFWLHISHLKVILRKESPTSQITYYYLLIPDHGKPSIASLISLHHFYFVNILFSFCGHLVWYLKILLQDDPRNKDANFLYNTYIDSNPISK